MCEKKKKDFFWRVWKKALPSGGNCFGKSFFKKGFPGVFQRRSDFASERDFWHSLVPCVCVSLACERP